jgi:hypothetical protein
MRLLTALLVVSTMHPRASFAADMNAYKAADVIVAPTVDGGAFGALAAADVDGDGIGDLVVGALNWGGLGQGAAFLFRGPMSGPATTDAAAAFTVTGPVGAVAVGDVDNDGLGDLLLGAPSVGDVGAAYLFDGPLTGHSDVADADATFSSSRFYLHHVGESVSMIADHTGDGVADILIGAPAWDKRAGSVFVLSGALTGTRDLVSASTYVYKNEEGHDTSGVSVAAIGDQDGDGLEDILIGACDERRAYVVDGGGPGGRQHLPDVAAAVIDGTGFRAGLFGTALASGDLDGDGYGDAVISAPYGLRASDPGGIVYAFLGPFSDAIGVRDSAARWEGEADTYGGFGLSVAAGSDVDGDGSTDVLIGDQNDDDPNGHSAVFLGLGPASGVTNAARLTSFRSPVDHQLGSSISFVPDTNDDGRPEIAGSAPGTGLVYLFFSDSVFE